MAIIFFRTIIIFITLLLFMRVLGKRQLGEVELSELVVSVLIANLAGLPLQDIGIPLLNGLIPVIILFCCELLISTLTMKSVRMRTLLCGRPSLLVENGVIRQKEMARSRFTIDELTEELRNQSIMDISTVKYAVLETDGTLNTILAPSQRPATAAQLGIQTTDNGFPIIIINDGHVLSDNLRHTGRDENWLKAELSRHGIRQTQDVYLLTVDAAGNVYFAEKEHDS
ncbi:MAG: DUF421 domain-containing protein [Clostridiales bacterium]|nr:DUF421 domain-containing protein [Clostridiales bacterium]